MGLNDFYFDLEMIYCQLSKEIAILIQNKFENIEKYPISGEGYRLISLFLGDIIQNFKSVIKIIKGINGCIVDDCFLDNQEDDD